MNSQTLGKNVLYTLVLSSILYMATTWDFFGLLEEGTYLGTLSELGLFGFLVLGGLIITVINCCMKIMRHKGSYHSIGFVGIIACFIAISVEAISTDIMNFRHYWVILALASMLVRNSE